MGVAMGAVVLSGAGTAAAQLVKSPAQAAADSGPPPKSVLTAPVERRVLKDSVITRGTVTSEQSVDVMPSAKGETSGAPLVTKTPVVAGAPVEHGTVLIEVSGRPVFALKGKLPAYRDMKPGMEGEDVAQLQTALGALGHGTGGDRSGSFGEGTKTALAAFYEGIGYDPVEAQPDGGISLRDARTAVTEAERRLQDARDALDEPGETKPGEGDQKPKALRKQVTRAQDDVEQARRALTEARAVSGPMLPASEVVFLSGFPARVDSLAVRVGSPATGRALTVSAGSLVVNGYLQAHQKSLVRPGQRVEILSELSGRG
jgi:peptidoglycan hydrolase-like protein with peptidoglycan-binding domain